MWILTTFGFFSIVQKPNDPTLTVRVADDLDRLRAQYLPTLGPNQAHGGTDYPVRAKVVAEELAHAMAEIVRDDLLQLQGRGRGRAGTPTLGSLPRGASLRKLEKSAKPS